MIFYVNLDKNTQLGGEGKAGEWRADMLASQCHKGVTGMKAHFHGGGLENCGKQSSETSGRQTESHWDDGPIAMT